MINSQIKWLSQYITDKDFIFSEIKTTPYSSIFEYQEYGITYILKTNLSTLNYEPEITQYLHNLFPEHILPIFLFSHENHCFSTKKVDAIESHIYFHEQENLDLLLKIISKFCEIQNKVSQQSLIDLHIRNLSFENLTTEFIQAIKGTPYEQFQDDFSCCHTNIQKDINELSFLGITNSIEHGDFHLGNILITPEHNFIFIDFAEATITNPFFSLISFIFSLERKLSINHNNPLVDQIKNTYFEKYSAFHQISLNNISKAYSISEKLFNIYYLITILELIKLEPNSQKRKERFNFHFSQVISDYTSKA